MATKKPAFMDRDSPQWERLANQLARGFCPGIYSCGECGGPVIKGYCCDRCGCENPEQRSVRKPAKD